MPYVRAGDSGEPVVGGRSDCLDRPFGAVPMLRHRAEVAACIERVADSSARVAAETRDAIEHAYVTRAWARAGDERPPQSVPSIDEPAGLPTGGAVATDER